MKMPEILAPAGDSERLVAAVTFGADAVYLGGKMFGMRASPANFSPDEMKSAVKYCHNVGVKVYVTCNTLPTNQDIEHLAYFIKTVSECKADAMIVADIGVLMEVKRIAPSMPVHISTQAGIMNYLTANEFFNLGASRIVLARELSLYDIATIRDKTPPELEIEAFVHGAMCMSFSGRCLISQYLVGRDANRGECAQPCRWSYHLMEEKRDGKFFPVFEDEKGSYILNAQDLCMLPHTDKLVKAGISSFKIEGRAKSAYYVAAITNAYRCAVDLYEKHPKDYDAPFWLIEEAQKVSHRQYSTGFFFPEDPPEQYYENAGYVRDWEVVAVVTGWDDGYLICSERNRFSTNELLEILVPRKKPELIWCSNMLDEFDEEIEIARHPKMRVKIKCDTQYPVGSMLRRRADEELSENNN